jgi:hypothetical protein
VGQERTSRWLQYTLVLALGVPTWMVLFGHLTRWVGLEYWPVIAALVAGMGGLASLVAWNLDSEYRNPTVWRWAAIASLSVLTLGNPTWSPLSGQLSAIRDVTPGVALGAWFGSYLVAQYFLPLRVKICLGVGLSVVALALHPWWADADWRWICLLVLPLLSEVDPRWLGALTLIPVPALLHGFQYSPHGVFGGGSSPSSLNLGVWVDVLVSPMTTAIACVAVVMPMVSTDFARHRMKVLWRQEAEVRYLARMSLGCAALSVLSPRLIETTAVVFALFLIVFALRALGPAEVRLTELSRS